MLYKINTLRMPDTAAALLSRFFEDYKKVGITRVTAAPCCLKTAMTAVSASVCWMPYQAAHGLSRAL